MRMRDRIAGTLVLAVILFFGSGAWAHARLADYFRTQYDVRQPDAVSSYLCVQPMRPLPKLIKTGLSPSLARALPSERFIALTEKLSKDLNVEVRHISFTYADENSADRKEYFFAAVATPYERGFFMVDNRRGMTCTLSHEDFKSVYRAHAKKTRTQLAARSG